MFFSTNYLYKYKKLGNLTIYNIEHQNFQPTFIINVKTVSRSLSVFQDSGSGCCVGGGDGAWAAV